MIPYLILSIMPLDKLGLVYLCKDFLIIRAKNELYIIYGQSM